MCLQRRNLVVSTKPVVSTQTLANKTVPYSREYTICCTGASNVPTEELAREFNWPAVLSFGAEVRATFFLTSGTKLRIIKYEEPIYTQDQVTLHSLTFQSNLISLCSAI